MNNSEPVRLRVAVNAYFSSHPNTGSGQYLSRLMAALPSVAPDCSVVAVPKFAVDSALENDRRSGVQRTSPLRKLWFEQVSLPRVARSQADVLHYPYWAAPLSCRLPVVVTVHDLIPLLLDAYRGPAPVRAYTCLVAAATTRATMLIADSQATKRDIVAHLRVPPEKIRVIYLAASERFHPAAAEREAESVARKYRLDRPFVFYVGGLDRRKNVDRLIEAFGRAQSSLFTAHILAIAGDAGRRGDLFPDLQGLVRRLGLGDSVRFLGVVPEDDLPALYRSAAVFAFPSSYEGFGLPPLEAMACGAPVVSSAAGSLAEVVGDAAVVVHPEDVPAWAMSLARVLNDSDLAATLRRSGPARAAAFDWRQTARQTAEVYREVAARWDAAHGLSFRAPIS